MDLEQLGLSLQGMVGENLTGRDGHRLYRSLVSDVSFLNGDILIGLLNNPLFPPECISVFSHGQQRSLESLRVWRTVQERRQAFFPFSELASLLLRPEMSCVIEGLDNYYPPIAKLARAIDEAHPFLLSNTACFWSKSGQETYRGHRDSQSVLAVQLSGRKRWRVFEPQGQRLLGNDKLSLGEMGNLSGDYVLSPGDALFVSGGVPHICDTVDGESIHIAFDLCLRSLPAEQIAQRMLEVFNREPFAGFRAADVVVRLAEILKSDSFVSSVSVAEEKHKEELQKFKKRISYQGNVS